LSILIGGASGYWGEATHATEQLLTVKGLDYLIYDYLAEITLSIMARARSNDSNSGYASDFVSDALAPNLTQIAANGVRVISNAGGMNPRACAHAISQAITQANLSLRVAIVEGDDLMDSLNSFADSQEMFSGMAFPDSDTITSANAYIGAFPIAAALNAGADIVITGRCVDSALTLAACIHEFDWKPDQFDLLAAGSLAGHLIECGPQVCGGNFTDWQLAGDFANIGYPLARIATDGDCIVSKPENTTGVVTVSSVAEQMLYEIGDPTAYILPDVVADFSNVSLTRLTNNEVLVSGACGTPAPSQYKASVTWRDGYRAGYLFMFNGVNASQKARSFAQTGLDRARNKLITAANADFSDTCIEVWGGNQSSDANTLTDTTDYTGNEATGQYEEVMLKTAVRHADAGAVGLFLKETMGAGLSAPPGLAGFTGAGRPKPSPVVRLFSCLIDKSLVWPRVVFEDNSIDCPHECFRHGVTDEPASVRQPAPLEPESVQQNPSDTMIDIPLEALAVARSGDKGDNANIGIIARQPMLLPWIWQSIDETAIRKCFADMLKGAVYRYYLPGSHSMNIVLEQSLGGGGIVSLRNDAQGKGYAQKLLATTVALPARLLQ